MNRLLKLLAAVLLLILIGIAAVELYARLDAQYVEYQTRENLNALWECFSDPACREQL